MFAVKVTVLVVLTQLAYGHVLEDATFISCLQKAILNGLPAADIPNHEPLHIPQNFTINRTIGLWELDADIVNIVWANIPWWNLTDLSIVSDDDTNQVWSFGLYWDYFNITADYDLALDGILVNYDLEGEIFIQMTEVNWTGTYNFTKATDTVNETLNALVIDWENGSVSVDISNMETLEELLDVSFKALIESAITTANSMNIFGQAFQYQINNKWLTDSDRMAALKAYCEN